MDEELKTIGYCKECGNCIINSDEEAYVDENGDYFCSIECVLESYGIHKIEF